MVYFNANSLHWALSWTRSACSISSQNPVTEPYEPVLYGPFPHKIPPQSLTNQFYMVYFIANSLHWVLSWTRSACSISSQNLDTEPYEPVLYGPFPYKIPSQSLMNQFCMVHFLTKSRYRALWTSSVWSISSQIPVIEPYHKQGLHVNFLTNSRQRALWTSSVWSISSQNPVIEHYHKTRFACSISSQNPGTEPYEPVLYGPFPHKILSQSLMYQFCMAHFLTNSRHWALSRTRSACSISSQNPGTEPYEPVLYVPFPHKFPPQSLMNQFYTFHFLTNSHHRALWTSSVRSIRSYITSPYSLLILSSHRPLHLQSDLVPWHFAVTFFFYLIRTSKCMLHRKPISSSIQLF